MARERRFPPSFRLICCRVSVGAGGGGACFLPTVEGETRPLDIFVSDCFYGGQKLPPPYCAAIFPADILQFNIDAEIFRGRHSVVCFGKEG